VVGFFLALRFALMGQVHSPSVAKDRRRMTRLRTAGMCVLGKLEMLICAQKKPSPTPDGASGASFTASAMTWGT
jgi:hypothetical protein